METLLSGLITTAHVYVYIARAQIIELLIQLFLVITFLLFSLGLFFVEIHTDHQLEVYQRIQREEEIDRLTREIEENRRKLAANQRRIEAGRREIEAYLEQMRREFEEREAAAQ
jgi:hypothetical protein